MYILENGSQLMFNHLAIRTETFSPEGQTSQLLIFMMKLNHLHKDVIKSSSFFSSLPQQIRDHTFALKF